MTTKEIRRTFALVIAAALLASGCGGGGGGGGGGSKDKLTPETLTSISAAQVQVNAAIMNTVVSGFLSDAVTYATENGETIPTAPTDPNPSGTGSALLPAARAAAEGMDCGTGWSGPAADGSYWRSCNYGYGDTTLTEHVKKLPSPQVGWEYWSELYMGDASGSTTITTKAQLVKGDHGLLSGYYDFKVDSSGGEVDSWGQWTFKFSNVDPATGAGHFEWWGGGDVNSLMPYGLFMTIDATVKDSQWLHLRIRWGEGADAFEWEFDCMHHPIAMPELPALP